MKDDILYLIQLLNTKANVTTKTPVGDTHPLLLSNLVKQGTVLGSVLCNCSLDPTFLTRKNQLPVWFGRNQTIFVCRCISDPNSSKTAATLSNKVLEEIQYRKGVTFSVEKCELC